MTGRAIAMCLAAWFGGPGKFSKIADHGEQVPCLRKYLKSISGGTNLLSTLPWRQLPKRINHQWGAIK